MNAKVRANVKARAAIAAGILVWRSCEVCGKPNAHAHHDDHKKPLDVRWLCPLHHAFADSERRERLGLRRKRARKCRDRRVGHPILRCQAERKRRGLTQTELGYLAGVTGSVMSDFERGRRQTPLQAKRLAKALGLKADELTDAA